MRGGAAIAGGAVATGGTVLALGGHGMTAHMVGHMAAVAVAAPLMALGMRGGWGGSPLAASVAELAVVWGWHLPAARALADGGVAWAMVEQLMFLGVGLWLWRAALDRPAAGVVALLLTSMHMTLLGALVALAPRPLYAMMAMHAPVGLGPLADQQLGGTAMLAIGGAAYLVGGLVLLAGLLRTRERAA